VARKKETIPDEAREYFRKQGAIGGKMGGGISWGKLTAEERSERARKAVAARKWHAVLTPEETAAKAKAAAKKKLPAKKKAKAAAK
jgi:hypothetical protein